MKTANSITFESWTAMDSERELAECERVRMSGPWRVWELSLARVSNWGHSAFKPGELVTLACGNDTPPNRIQLHRWIKVLAQMGRIDPERSTPLCILVNRDIAQRNRGKGARKDLCWEPMHSDIREMPYWPSVIDGPDPWEVDGMATETSEAHTETSEPDTKMSEAHTETSEPQTKTSWRQTMGFE
jgi:hypothetical protein